MTAQAGLPGRAVGQVAGVGPGLFPAPLSSCRRDGRKAVMSRGRLQKCCCCCCCVKHGVWERGPHVWGGQGACRGGGGLARPLCYFFQGQLKKEKLLLRPDRPQPARNLSCQRSQERPGNSRNSKREKAGLAEEAGGRGRSGLPQALASLPQELRQAPPPQGQALELRPWGGSRELRTQPWLPAQSTRPDEARGTALSWDCILSECCCGAGVTEG